MTINLDFISDFVCPWCWLGIRRLTVAIETFGADKVSVKFRPFQLDATIPEPGLDYQAFMLDKFGPPGETNKLSQMQKYLEEAGKSEGVPFRFQKMKYRPNTLNAHRLMRWAQGQGFSLDAAEAIFSAHFARLMNIGDLPTLLALGEEIGLMPDILEKLFREDADRTSIAEEENFFRSLGVQGVPVVIAQGRLAIQGAQDSATYLQFLQQATRESEPASR